MKKVLVTIAIALIAVGAASAQPWTAQTQPWTGQQGMAQGYNPAYGRGYGAATQATPVVFEKLTLEGSLELINGNVAIKKDDKTYYVMIPNRLYGFVDGLKEGALVKVEGYSHEIAGLKDSYAVRVETLTINGRTIDLGTPLVSSTQMDGGMMRGNSMPMGRWNH